MGDETQTRIMIIEDVILFLSRDRGLNSQRSRVETKKLQSMRTDQGPSTHQSVRPPDGPLRLGTLAKCSRLTPALAMLVAPVVSTCVRRWFTGRQSSRPSVMGLLEHLSSCRQYPDTRGAPNSSSAVRSAYCTLVSESGRAGPSRRLSRPLRNERMRPIRGDTALEPCPLLRPGILRRGHNISL